jgi:hypothetical protein
MKTLIIAFAIGFLFGCTSQKEGYRFRISADDGVKVTACQKAPAFQAYLDGLNKILAPKGSVCIHTADPTPTSHTIECSLVAGPSQATMYWDETKEGCESLLKGMSS